MMSHRNSNPASLDSGSLPADGSGAPHGNNVAMALFATAMPLLLGNLLNSLTGTGTSIWFGQLMGDRAIAVVAFFYPIMFFFISLVMGWSSGATVAAAKAHGAGDTQALRNLTKTTLLFAAVLGLTTALSGALFLKFILDAMGAPGLIRHPLEIYAYGMFLLMPLLFLFLSLSGLLRGIGHAGLASRMVAITSIVILTVLPLFVLAGGGYEGYGVAAYAAASVAAYLAVLAYFYRYAKKRRLPIGIGWSDLSNATFDSRSAREMLKIGLPSSLQMNLTSLSHISMMGLIAHYGEQAVAGFGAANQLLGYAQYPVYSLGIAASILCAQAIGARNRVRIRRIESMSIVLAVAGGAIVAVVMWALAKPLLALFLQGQQASSLALEYMGLSLLGLFFSGLTATLCSLLRANGDTWWPSMIGLAAIWLVQIPLAYLLQTTHGLQGVWWSFPAGAVAGLFFTVIYYLVQRKSAAKANEHQSADPSFPT